MSLYKLFQGSAPTASDDANEKEGYTENVEKV